MTELFEFMKIHTNLGAGAGLIFILALILFSKGNIKYGSITTITFIGYMIFLHYKVRNDPNFMDRLEESKKQLDVEEIFWGAEKASQYREASEKRDSSLDD